MKKMNRTTKLDVMLDDVGWEYTIPYEDLTNVDKSKTTSKTLYVVEDADEKPISFRAVNFITLFIEKPEATRRIVKHKFPDLYDKYVDTPEARELMEPKEITTTDNSTVIAVNKMAPCPLLKVVNEVENRGLKPDMDNIRRNYVELYRLLVEGNPEYMTIAYSSNDKTSHFGCIKENKGPGRVIFSELEQNSAIL